MLDSAFKGASTDPSNWFTWPYKAESSAPLSWQGMMGDSTFELGTRVVLDEFISARYQLALRAAFDCMFSVATACRGPHTKTYVAADDRPDLCLPLRCITINVRSMNDVGKTKFVLERLHSLSADIVFIQETRLPEKFDFTMLDKFHVVAAPAISGQGGLLILVRQDSQCVLESHRAVGPRVLVASVKVASLKLKLLCLHAPTAESPLSAHDTFAGSVDAAVRGFDSKDIVIIGSDMNARLGGLSEMFECVGSQAVSYCPEKAFFRHSCLKHLEKLGLCAVNTIIAEPTDVTWRHPLGTEQQIDYIWLPKRLMENGKVLDCRVGEWAFFDCGTTSDHRHVQTTVMLEVCTARSRNNLQRKKAQFHNEQHIVDAVAKVNSALQPWDSQCEAGKYISRALDVAAESILATAPKTSPVRQPWISKKSWDHMQVLNEWRKLQHALKRGDARLSARLLERLAPQLPPCACGCPPSQCSCTCANPLWERVCKKVHSLKAENKKNLRADRKHWFNTLADEADSHEKDRRPRELHRVVRRMSKLPQARGTRVQDENGTVVSEKASVAGIWLQYWLNHFGARMCKPSPFNERVIFTEEKDCHLSYDDGADELAFTEEEVLATLKRMQKWKATADKVPASALIAIAPLLAKPLCSLFNSCLRRGAVPMAYAGARLVPVYKKKGPTMSCSSFRPVALMMLEAKLLARLCLQKLTSRLQYHSMQFGSGYKCGVCYPQVIVQQFAALARASNVPSATIFVDIKSAFDAVPLPFLWGAAEPSRPEDEFVGQGFSQQTAAALVAHLSLHPCILDKVGVPQSILPLLRSWGNATWLITSEDDDDRAIKPCTGVPQGHNLSALLFDIFFADIMKDADVLLQGAHICLELPSPQYRDLAINDAASVCSIGGTAFRDDYALPVSANSNSSLINMISHAMHIFEQVLKSRHLTVNYAKGKTECTIQLTSATAKAYFQGLKMVGKAAGRSSPAILLPDDKVLLVSNDYPHLGRAHMQNGSQRQEQKCRLGKMSSAFQQRQKVVLSPSLSARVRLSLFGTYVACHLTQNSGIAPAMSESEYMKMKAMYMVHVRKVVQEASNAHRVSLLSDSDVCKQFRVSSFLTLVDRRRLMMIFRLLTNDAPQLRALLAATDSTGSVWTGVFASLSRLMTSHPVLCAELPQPSLMTLPQWSEFIVSHHETWASIVRAHRVPDYAKDKREGSTSVPPPDLDAQAVDVVNHSDLMEEDGAIVQTATRLWQCPQCEFKGKTNAGLAMHMRRKHNEQTPLSLRLVGSVCPACRLPYDTRHRALDHLRAGRRCREWVLSNIEPMSPRAHQAAVEIERGQVHSFTRSIAPKAGPKPAGARPPLNGVVPIFVSEEQRLAATVLS
eukprot:6471629-Amphidinium_carterae.5